MLKMGQCESAQFCSGLLLGSPSFGTGCSNCSLKVLYNNMPCALCCTSSPTECVLLLIAAFNLLQLFNNILWPGLPFEDAATSLPKLLETCMLHVCESRVLVKGDGVMHRVIYSVLHRVMHAGTTNSARNSKCSIA